MIDAADCKAIRMKGMHLYMPYKAPTGEVKECCYFCGNPRPWDS